MAAGRLNKRATFRRLTVTDDGGGGGDETWVDLEPVWAARMPERGAERFERGRDEATAGSVLRVRYSAVTAGITEADRVLVDNIEYNIRFTDNPDQRKKFIEMTIERRDVG